MFYTHCHEEVTLPNYRNPEASPYWSGSPLPGKCLPHPRTCSLFQFMYQPIIFAKYSFRMIPNIINIFYHTERLTLNYSQIFVVVGFLVSTLIIYSQHRYHTTVNLIYTRYCVCQALTPQTSRPTQGQTQLPLHFRQSHNIAESTSNPLATYLPCYVLH